MATTASVRIVADTSQVDEQLLRDLTRIIDEIQRSLPDVEIDVDVDTTGLAQAQRAADDTDGSFVNLFATVGRLIGTFARFTVAASVTGTALAGLVTAIGGVVTALGGVEGIANQAAGGLAVILAARGVLQVALTGISDAFAALGEDAETFNDAIEGLAPAAQNVAREFRASVPAFDRFRDGLQQALFAEIDGEESARRLAGTLSTLRPAASSVAVQFGNLADGLIDLVTAPRIVEDLNQILTKTSEILDAAVPKIINFVDGAITRAADGTGRFGETLNALRGFAESVGAVFEDIGRIFSAVGAAAAGTGANIGGPLALALDLVADVLESDTGQAFLRTLFELGQTITNALLPAAGRLLGALAEGLRPVIEALAPILGEVALILADYVDQISPLLPLVGELAASFLGALGPALTLVSALLTSLVPPFVQLYAAVLPALVPLVDALVLALDELIAPLTDIAIQLGPPLAELLAALAPLFVATVESVIPLIPVITELALVATDFASDIADVLVPAIEGLAALLRGDFSGAGQAAEEVMRRSIDLIIGYFTDLPRRLISALNELNLVLARRSSDAAESLVRNIREGVSDALSALVSLPREAAVKLGNLGATLYSSGRALVEGFIQGILSRIGDLRDAAGSLLDAARDYFPGSPAKTGPFSGLGYTTHSGAALMDDFIAAIRSRSGALQQTVAGALSGAQATFSASVQPAGAASVLGRQFAMAGPAVPSPNVAVYIGNEAVDRHVERIVVTTNDDARRRAVQGVRR